MKMNVFLIALTLALPAGALERRGESRRDTTTFELLRAGGGVSHVHTDCDVLLPESERVGDWFCLNGDGTSEGTLALSAVGSPTTQTDKLCPSGPDCAETAGQRLNGSADYFTTGAQSTPTGDFSGCALFNADDPSVGQMLISKDSDVAGGRALELGLTRGSPSAPHVAIRKNDTTQTIVTGAVIQSGRVTFVCFTYDFIADGTSVLRLYVDGAQVGSTAAAVGPAQANTTAWEIGRRPYTSFNDYFKGSFFSAFETEKVLSADTISAMSKAAHAQLQGSRGESTTTTRTTTRSCIGDGGGSILRAGAACVMGAALHVWGAHSNLLLRSEEFNNAAWSSSLGVNATVAADYALAPNGTKTADRINQTGGANGSYYQTRSVTSGTQFTVSAWVRATSTADDFTVGIDCGVAGTPVITCSREDGGACTAQANSAGAAGAQANIGTTPVRLIAMVTCPAATTSVTPFVRPSVFGSTTDTGDAVFWGAMLNTGLVAPPYVPCFGTAPCNVNAENITVPTGSGWPTTTGSISLDYTPLVPNTTAAKIFVDTRVATNQGWVFYHNNPSLTLILGDGAAYTAFTSTTLTWTVGTTYRVTARWDAGAIRIYRDGVEVLSDTVATGRPSSIATTAKVGSDGSVSHTNGAVSNVCVDPNPEACR